MFQHGQITPRFRCVFRYSHNNKKASYFDNETATGERWQISKKRQRCKYSTFCNTFAHILHSFIIIYGRLENDAKIHNKTDAKTDAKKPQNALYLQRTFLAISAREDSVKIRNFQKGQKLYLFT